MLNMKGNEMREQTTIRNKSLRLTFLVVALLGSNIALAKTYELYPWAGINDGLTYSDDSEKLFIAASNSVKRMGPIGASKVVLNDKLRVDYNFGIANQNGGKHLFLVEVPRCSYYSSLSCGYVREV